MHPCAITWFEYQFGDKNNKHLDAVIINPQEKEILLVESKRFSNPNSKLGEMREDVERIKAAHNARQDEFDRIVDFEQYAFRGVVLADVWCEGNSKAAIFDAFEKQIFAEKYQIPLPAVPEYYIASFPDCQYGNIQKNYHLVSFMWEISG